MPARVNRVSEVTAAAAPGAVCLPRSWGEATAAVEDQREARAARRAWRMVAAGIGGLTLFGLNSLGPIGGWLASVPGHAPAFSSRATDLAVYRTWVAGFTHDAALPNYHAPWQTEAVFFNAMPFAMARTARALGLDSTLTYHLFHAAFYVLAAASLVYAIRTFTADRRETRWAWTAIVLSVPVTSLLLVPFSFADGLGASVGSMPGIGDYVFWTSDGFWHGISGSAFVTFATATTLLAFALLARYLQTNRRRYLAATCAVAFVSAFVHPYEIVVICAAASLTLVVLRRGRWRLLLGELAAINGAGLIGVLPLSLIALQTPWIRAAAEVNRWDPVNPLRLLLALGVPAIAAVVLLVVKPKLKTPTDLLLQMWVVSTLVGIYIPWMHWSQHLLDGFLYAAALLVVRQIGQMHAAARMLQRPAGTALVAALLVLSVTAAVVYRWQSFADGGRGAPHHVFSAVTPIDERSAIEWLRREAQPDELVLAPPDQAPWFATVPMHSFASHFAYSLTFAEQRAAAERFFAGEMTTAEARALLREYGVRYVVAPVDSAALGYFADRAPAATLGTLLVFRFPEHAMRPYVPAIRATRPPGQSAR